MSSSGSRQPVPSAGNMPRGNRRGKYAPGCKVRKICSGVPSAGKSHGAENMHQGAKRGKYAAGCHARENKQAVQSSGYRGSCVKH